MKVKSVIASKDQRHAITAAPKIARAAVMRAAMWRLGEGAGLEIFSFAFFLVLGRLLVPDAFGVVAIAGTFIQACRPILGGGLGAAVRQRAELESEHLTAALWANVGLGVLCSLVLIALAWPLSVLQGKGQLLPVLMALTPVLLLSSASWIIAAYLKRLLRYDLVALCTYASILAGGAVGVALAYRGAGVWSLVGQQVAGAFVGLVGLMASMSWRPGLIVSRRHLRELMTVASKTTASEVLDFVSQRLDVLILGFILTAHAIGLYFVASRLTVTVGIMTYYVVYDLTLGVLPRFDVRSSAFREASYRTLQFTSLFSLPAFIGLALVAEPAILLMFGPTWSASAPPLQMMCLFGVAYALTATGRQILVAAGRAGLGLALASVNAVLCLVIIPFAAPAGVAAAAAAGGVVASLCLPLMIFILRRTLGLKVRRVLADQLPIWGATGIMVLAVTLAGRIDALRSIADSPVGALVLKASVGCAVFAMALRLLGPDLFRTVVGLSNLRTRGEAGS